MKIWQMNVQIWVVLILYFKLNKFHIPFFRDKEIIYIAKLKLH